jgi:DNA-binding FadR family transcriptional regulator
MNAIAAHDGDLAEEAMCKLIDGAQEVILTMID